MEGCVWDTHARRPLLAYLPHPPISPALRPNSACLPACLQLLLLTSNKAIMGAAFVNRPATTALCWAIAAAIIAINCSTAFESISVYLPPRAGWLHAGAPHSLPAYNCP